MQVGKRDVLAADLKDVLPRVRTVQQRPACGEVFVMEPFDGDAWVGVSQFNGRGDGVGSVVHQDDVPGLQLILDQDPADGVLRAGGGEAVIGRRPHGGGPVIYRDRVVVHVVGANGAGHLEGTVRVVRQAVVVRTGNPDQVVLVRRHQQRINGPLELTVVLLVQGDLQVETGCPFADQFNVDRGPGAHGLGAPFDDKGLADRPSFIAVRVQQQHILGRALGGVGRVAVGPEVDEVAVGYRLQAEV